MAAQVGPLPQIKLASGPSPITAEQRYWKSFKNNVSIPSPAGSAVTHITYNPPGALSALDNTSGGSGASDVFAVTTGSRVLVYSARACKLVKTLTRFTDNARSANVRPDGRIVAAGDDQGLVQVFDLSSRAILRTWAHHKPQPVWAVRFSPTSLTTLVSAGDDRTVRLWDLPSEDPVVTLRGHQDYVRCAAFVPGRAGDEVFVTGSYDSTVRLWDPRTGGSVMAFKHAAPIEDVLPLPSGTTVLATASNSISVLDLVAARPMQLITNHQKTVTTLSLASGGRRVVSGGLDGHVKVFETTNWNVVYGCKYDNPVFAVKVIGASDGNDDVSDRHLLVGMDSGVLSIKTRLTGAAASRERERKREMDVLLAGHGDDVQTRKEKRKRRRENAERLDMAGEGADVVIVNERRRRKNERAWQRDVRFGRFGSALDRVINPDEPGYHALDAMSLFVTLRHRSAMREALAGRDETTALPVIKWVAQQIANPRYVSLCVEVALHLIDLYAEHVAASEELHKMFRLVHRRVKEEVERSQVACQTGGMLESLMMPMD